MLGFFSKILSWGLRAVLLAALNYAPAHANGWRARSAFYKPHVIREARAQWGLSAPIALFAGQIHQESLWKKSASSKYANGLTQFTPSTEKWIKRVFPRDLGRGNAFNPQWAIRAMVIYDKWLYRRIKASTNCDRWAMTLAAYNGGLGWINRDKRRAKRYGKNPLKWWRNVENHSRRAKWAFKENRGYPRKIIYQHQPKYFTWGGRKICL